MVGHSGRRAFNRRLERSASARFTCPSPRPNNSLTASCLKNRSTGHQPTTLRTMTLATLATKDCDRFSLPQIWVQNPVNVLKLKS